MARGNNRSVVLQSYFVVTLVALDLGLLSSVLWDIFAALRDGAALPAWYWRWNGPCLAVSVVLLCPLYCWSESLRKSFWTPHTRRWRADAVEPRQHLIFFLSSRSDKAKFNDHGVPEGLALGADLTNDLQAWAAGVARNAGSPARWNWAPALRAIAAHLPTLRHVYCVCSPESIGDFANFQRLLAHYPETRSLVESGQVWLVQHFPAGVNLVNENSAPKLGGWNFEEFDDLTSGLHELFDKIVKRGGAQSDIALDITGGTKVVSAAGLAATIDLAVKAQYVQTNAPYTVKMYDVVVDRPNI